MFLAKYKSLFLNSECLLLGETLPNFNGFLNQVDWHTNLAPFQRARPDHVRVESSSCCFPRELVNFVRPRELVSFDPWHVTRSPPFGKRI